MEKRLPITMNQKPIYDIIITNSFLKLGEELDRLETNFHKICIITDSNVIKEYGDEVSLICREHSVETLTFSFAAGEAQKNLDTVKDLYKFLIESHFDRNDFLLALGGGVVGDLTGYAAATYLRGISFIQVPTTLLSQVDSSIGGKTGVDFDQYKNMVGAFHMPKLVFSNVSTLSSLESRQFFSGMGEVMKHGLIKDAHYYEWLISNMYEICEKDIEILIEMIYRSNEIKKNIVEKDPFEKGDRALLNLGHTIGHAIEKHKNFELLHGECVALGCVAAAFISYKKQLLSSDEYYEIRDMFVPFYLPITICDINIAEIVANTKSDKKINNGKIKFVLLKKIGKAIIDETVTDDELKEAIEEIHYEEGQD